MTEMRTFTSSIEDFRLDGIKETELVTSLQLLLEKDDGKTRQDVEDTGLEEGEIRQENFLDPKIDQAESNRLEIKAKVDENSKEDRIDHGDDPKVGADIEIRVKVDESSKEARIHGDPKVGADIEIRVKVDENPKEGVSDEREFEKYVTDVFGKIDFMGNKRGILLSDPTERSLKKRLTRSYSLIPKEKQSPVSDKVLNNECFLKKVDNEWSQKKQTVSEEAIAKCEEDMFEADMLMEDLRSAVEKVEKVMRKEMRMEGLGVKFYRCIEMLYRGDMVEMVRDNHKQALPVILPRLKQKLEEVTLARQRWKSGWKQVFKENSAKLRDATAQGHRKS